MKILTTRGWLLAPAALIILAAWTPTDDGPTVCPFALMTGHACPGCGLTRAMASLVQGNFQQSVLYHPLAPILALALALSALWWWGSRRGHWKPPSTALINASLSVTGVALIAVWLGRLATGTLPPV